MSDATLELATEEIEPGRGALVVIPASALPTILAADANDILGTLSKKVAAHKPDISTVKGRKEIASLAAEVASSKMDLIRLGKSLTEGWRKQTAAVNAECNLIEQRMDALKVQVRQPLTEFESRERERIAAHETALAEIPESAGYGQTETSEEISQRLNYLLNYPAREWQEFGQRASDALAEEIDRTGALLAAAQKREAEATELERLRAEEQERRRQEAARLQAEREAQIARESAARARAEAERIATERAAEAERAAQAERDRIENEARAAAAAAEAERQRLIREAEEQRQAAARREREATERAERAERERAEAARRAEAERVAAAERAERDRIAAVAAERRRQEQEAAQIAEEARKREENKSHRAQINREAALDLQQRILLPDGHSLPKELAQAIVVAIAKSEVRHIRIEY